MMQSQENVRSIFNSVSKKYDLMNDLMSLGLHRLWKRHFCSYVENLNSKIIDVASGSGDIAHYLYKKAQKQNTSPDITLSDINENMLELAKEKFFNSGLYDNFKYVIADSSSLPFADNTFDYYTVAFGIRNMENIQLVLNEAHRILKPGGKFLCLEFSKPSLTMIKKLYDIYSFKIIPKIGKYIAKDQNAYEYLVESIRAFPDQNIFASMMEKAGFKVCSFENINFSISSIYYGYKNKM